MSLVNIVLDDDAGHLLTDAGAWGNDCKIKELRHKSHILPHLHSVVTSRGNPSLSEYITQAISKTCSSFDELTILLSPLCKREYYKYYDAGTDLEFWLVGYSSKAREVQAYGLCNEGLTLQDHGFVAAPWELARVKENLYLPWYGKAEDKPSFATGPVVETAIALAEKQRRMPVRTPSGIETYSVAGFLQQTTVTELGVFSRVIHRWPDKIGHEVNPFSVI